VLAADLLEQLTMSKTRFGLSCAISTPFDENGAIDLPRL
jgi:hypothetical protein